MSHGPLTDVRLVEVAGIGPGPFTCMVLADTGADVLRPERGRAWVGGDGRHPLNLDGADVEGLAATRVIAHDEEGT
jgi:crotonobetainyl-CoA:carnitine CoA-transferase CaiB-like acyl-CoA transferase